MDKFGGLWTTRFDQGAALVALDDELLDDVEPDEDDELDEEDVEDDEPESDDFVSDDFVLDEDESELVAAAAALVLLPDSDRLSVR